MRIKQNYPEYNIVVMLRKQNRSAHKYKQKNLPTADLTNVLQAINQNTSWKNQSSKIQPNKSPPATMSHAKNQMTEVDIEKLFICSNKKKSSKPQKNNKKNEEPRKDFASCLKFLKLEDEADKFLTGLDSAYKIKQWGKNEQTGAKQCNTDLTKKFKSDYLVGKVIGEGAYASVRVAIYKPSNKKIAIKVYEKEKIKEIQRKKSIRRQIKILQSIDHPNIVKLYNVVQTNNHLNLIMEYLSGISLNIYLKNQQRQKINQKVCRHIIKSLAKALQYLHSKRIAHRDIKLQNIILDHELNPKLIDFGFSTCIEGGKRLKIFCGTPSYMAPEIVQKKQYRGQNADIWALGVLFYVIMIGFFPFKGSTDEELHAKINKADYPKADLLLNRQATDLMSKMLITEPQKRITARQILCHPWIQNLNGRNLSQKVSKKKSSSNDYKKRTVTMSSNKSKDDIHGREKRKLTQTCKENLRLDLKFLKNQGDSKKNTETNVKFEKDLMKLLRTEENKEDLGKIRRSKRGQKVMELLRMEVKKKEGSKGKNRRF